jgi:hypothetical protein
MWPFNSPAYNSFFTFLTTGSPSLLTQFAIANAALFMLFIYFRGKKTKLDYQRTKGQLQFLTVIANAGILFNEPLMASMKNALHPFRGMLDFL